MARWTLWTCVCLVVATMALTVSAKPAEAAPPGQPTNWGRYYHYPYVYYPHNLQPSNISYDHMYYRYPAARQIPVQNKAWHNFYSMPHPYHKGNHFSLDVF